MLRRGAYVNRVSLWCKLEIALPLGIRRGPELEHFAVDGTICRNLLRMDKKVRGNLLACSVAGLATPALGPIMLGNGCRGVRPGPT